MDIIGKLVRLLQDDYKFGAEMRSGKPILYVDPKQLDQWQIEIDAKRGNLKGVADQMAQQLDAAYPGISKNFSQKELIQLVVDSLQNGPFAWKFDHGVTNGTICLINQPKHNEIKVDQIYNTFGLNTTFNPAHLRPLGGTNAEWAQFVGEHEGEHCNQDPVYNTDPESDVKMLNGEVLSDRAALETLRKEGKHDLVAQIKAIRALAAANGDHGHATSMFLDDPEFNGVTREHLDAAKSFSDEMSMGVAVNLGISVGDANLLRREDPQKFAKATEDAMTKGQIPALRDMSDESVKITIAKTMGLTVEELESADASKVSETYQKLKAEGALQDRGTPNPHTNKYIQNYIDATKVLFVADTTPAVAPKPQIEIETAGKTKPGSENEQETPADPTEEELAEAAKSLDDDLRYEANVQSYRFMDEMVSKALGLDEEGLKNLLESDVDKYYEIAAQELAKGNFQTQTEKVLSSEERNQLIAKRLGITFDELANQPEFLLKLAENELIKENALKVKRDNPHIQKVIADEIQLHHEQKAKEAEAAASADAAPDTDLNLGPKAETASTSKGVVANPISANAGKYDHLLNIKPDDGNGIPQIDLRSEDRGQMKIGSLTTSEYFATKADPVLAAQALKPDMGVETKDPSLTTKVARNDQQFQAMA